MALRDSIPEHFWLKLFSLALAVLIWVTVSFAIKNEVTTTLKPMATTSSRRFHDLPVLIVSAAADVREFKVNPRNVDVTVIGEAEVLEKLRREDIRVSVDLTDIASAQSLRKRVEVSTPPGVTHIRVDPSDVELVVPPKPAVQPPSTRAR